MKSKRCDCVKSEDLRKAIISLKELSKNFDKAFRKSCFNYSIGYDCVFDPALIPFDMVANGAKVSVDEEYDCVDLSGDWENVKIDTDDKISVGGFSNAWMSALENAFGCLDVQAFVEVYSAFSRVMNGFGNESIGRGVFVSDYGYFRGALARCLILSFNKNTGGSSERELIFEIKKNIGIVNRKAEEAAFAACGKWGDEECKSAQVMYAANLYEDRVKNGRVEISMMNQVLKKATSEKRIFEHEITAGLGYPEYNSKLGANKFYKKVQRELIRRGVWKGKK